MNSSSSSQNGPSLIKLRGVRTHNLQNINVDFPKNQLTVVTGVSGSGKSSLAFDTLYAEGQRRYIESLSSYAKQFLHIADKPEYDSIEGLSPTISIDQKSTSHNPRSTVGTVTEIYDYLRLLFSHLGTLHCPTHKLPLTPMPLAEMISLIQSKPENSRWMLLSPIIRNRKGEYQRLLASIQQKGFTRVRVNGVVYDNWDEIPSLKKNLKHTIEAVVDRFKISPQLENRRLSASLETALALSDGLALLVDMDTTDPKDTGQEQLLSSKNACPMCDFSAPELEPKHFSFNNPSGACEDCGGLGSEETIDGRKLIPDPSLSLEQGSIQSWGPSNNYYYQLLKALSSHLGFSLQKPFQSLLEEHKTAILYGHDEPFKFQYTTQQGRSYSRNQENFEGVIPSLKRRYRETDSNPVREQIFHLMSLRPCSSCQGTRLGPLARNATFQGHAISDLTAQSIELLIQTLTQFTLNPQQETIAQPIFQEIKERLHFLHNVGLGYLTLSRSANTLSGGEAQRIRLASQIGSGLTGVIYVLDEPSIGLHQRDNGKLLKTLLRLRDLGNTLIVVEHDQEAMETADHIIDIGPDSGVHGGEVVACGDLQAILTQTERSHTAKHLAGLEKMTPPTKRSKGSGQTLSLTGARSNNLKEVSISLPLGALSCITGVSGSGKSTLINQTLCPALLQKLGREPGGPIGEYDTLKGIDHIKSVIRIDQSPIGRTPRSNPATYTQVFTPIRELMASTEEARLRGYDLGRFSFNSNSGGRCDACRGDGVILVEMHFMANVYVTCEVCQGKRYNEETLEVRFKGKNISDILAMTVDAATEFFAAIPSIYQKLHTLQKVGLGYIELGHSATHLSGGEAQRIRLARELSKRDQGETLYILDEPSTGLHFHDICKLMNVLLELKNRGNTVIVIEHNLDIIKMADYIIDMGPEGGNGGGEVIAMGTPEQVAACQKSYTGQYLKTILDSAFEASAKQPKAKPKIAKAKPGASKTKSSKAPSKKA